MLETEAQQAQGCHLCLQVKCIFLRHKRTLCVILCCNMSLLVRYIASKSAVCRKIYLASSPSPALAVQESWKVPRDVCGMQWSAQCSQCALWPWHLQFHSTVQYSSGNLWPMAAETETTKVVQT